MNMQFDKTNDIINHAFSRPPKIQLTGTLIPNYKNSFAAYKFKLETDDGDYFLSMSAFLSEVAKKIEWEVVTVKGRIDFLTKEIDVEKLSLADVGKIDTAVDELAS